MNGLVEGGKGGERERVCMGNEMRLGMRLMPATLIECNLVY